MQMVISLTHDPHGTMPLNEIFIVYDTETKKDYHYSVNGIPNPGNINRGMGMCYFGGFFYGACFAQEHRVGSKLLITDTKRKKTQLNDLSFTKAIHSITPYGKCGPYTMILANSTQNDCVTIITTKGTEVVTEDLFFDFLNNKERMNLDWSKEYEFDDLLHVNCVYQHGKYTFTSMFLDYGYDNKSKAIKGWRKDNEKKRLGAIYNLNSQTALINNLTQPHSVICDFRGDLICCESGNFSVINVHRRKRVILKGFTRGLVEDKLKGGYWVGLSYHRKFCTEIPGAMIQFIPYDMNNVEDPIDISHLGKEVYDMVKFAG